MKSELRNRYKKIRATMNPEEATEKSVRATEHFLKSSMYQNAKVLMLYMPLGKETDTRDVVRAAYRDKKTVCFPVTDADGTIMAVEASENARFTKGTFSVAEPKDAKKTDKHAIDVVLVPGIAFARKGMRIGFGKGCYDRFLKDMKSIKIGFCYEEQLTEHIESEPTDIPMDYIITQNGVISCKGEEK